MKEADNQLTQKAPSRQTGIYFILIVFTTIFIFLYSSPINSSWMTIVSQLRPAIKVYLPELPAIEQGFLVYSKSCKIPDLDPMHPSIKNLVEYSAPINCSVYEPLTRTDGNVLHVDYKMAESRSFHNISCCYKALFRDEEGSSDNKVRFSEQCKELKNATIIHDEFITVECSTATGSVIYKNFHSFIHDKPEVEQRCQNSSAQYSIILLGVDSMSRMNMHRQLNKTASYLLNNMDAIEMYGFNKVGDNTFPNLVPLLLGYDERELPKVCWNSTDYPLDKCNFLWNHFKKRGYRTFYAEDTPYISSFNYQKLGFYHQPTDYYFRNFILAFENALGRDKPLNCHLCVGSISETEAVLEWTQRFATNFKDRPYFAFAWINSLTHDYLNMGSSGDHIYEQFFKTLHSSGSLNKTIIFIMGDHGMRWGEIRSTYIGRLEERLPMLMMVLPPEFKRANPLAALALKQNSHRLTTPYDLHATLDNILRLNEDWRAVDTSDVDPSLKDIFSKRALSLFSPMPFDRSCKDAFIDEHWCTCQMSLVADPNTTEVKLVALYLVNQLNSILKTRASLCAMLNLNSVIESRVWNPPSENVKKTPETNTYTIVVQTEPGDGVFEATARFNSTKNSYELLGTVSRLNLYGNQSTCVKDAILQKYCYCL